MDAVKLWSPAAEKVLKSVCSGGSTGAMVNSASGAQLLWRRASSFAGALEDFCLYS
jgi:predicted Rossmann-fold nucleotide-binding protein